MKKASKFLALILSSVTLFSHIGIVRATPPGDSPDSRSKENIRILTLDNLINFKEEILSGGSYLLKIELANIRVAREEIEALNELNLPLKFELLRGCEGDKISRIGDRFGTFHTMLALNQIVNTCRSRTMSFTPFYPNREDIVYLLYTASAEKMKIPDVLCFNHLRVEVRGRTVFITFKQDGRAVFGFVCVYK